jgi:aryl-alcohol dehydrogenase-like predicted oxidoreductase
VFVGIDGEVAGALISDDPIRPDTPRVIRTLRRTGIQRVVMVTGDHPDVAESVGAALGVDRILSERAPDEKVDAVTAERREGVVMMVGIVVSNSILIVEFTHRLREEGKPLREAVALACRVRLRPVLMTSLATLIGLIPMAAKLGTGSEAYAPLARAIIGGLAMSVVLTVFIVPAAYLLVYRRRESRLSASRLQQPSAAQ